VQALRDQALAAMRAYFAYLERREHNAATQLGNWLDARLPQHVTRVVVVPDPLATAWDRYLESHPEIRGQSPLASTEPPDTSGGAGS
jgi:hypothetical protein